MRAGSEENELTGLGNGKVSGLRITGFSYTQVGIFTTELPTKN